MKHLFADQFLGLVFAVFVRQRSRLKKRIPIPKIRLDRFFHFFQAEIVLERRFQDGSIGESFLDFCFHIPRFFHPDQVNLVEDDGFGGLGVDGFQDLDVRLDAIDRTVDEIEDGVHVARGAEGGPSHVGIEFAVPVIDPRSVDKNDLAVFFVKDAHDGVSRRLGFWAHDGNLFG